MRASTNIVNARSNSRQARPDLLQLLEPFVHRLFGVKLPGYALKELPLNDSSIVDVLYDNEIDTTGIAHPFERVSCFLRDFTHVIAAIVYQSRVPLSWRERTLVEQFAPE
ncbi:MAG: hypothetical protein R3C01_02875 [Planctomycetaceae bacterium]